MQANAHPRIPTHAIAAAIAAALLAAGAAGAAPGQSQQDRQQGGSEQQAQQSGQGSILPDAYKTSHWIGKPVENLQGDKLGTVKELIMDDWGVIRFVVMQTDHLQQGGQQGQGQQAQQGQGQGQQAQQGQGQQAQQRGQGQGRQLVAVPMGHFRFPLTAQDRLVFETDRTKLQAAPAFAAEQDWPNMGDQTWSALVITYWLPEDAQQAQRQQGQGMGRQDEQQQAQAGGQQGQQQAQQQAEQQGQQQAQQSPQTSPWQGGTQPGTAGGYFAPNRDMVYLSREQEQRFSQLDKNQDNSIDRQEAQASDRLSQRFDRIDSYGNDRITRSEFAAFELEDGQQGQSGRQSN